MYDVIIPAQGEFGKCHPGWGREYRKAFFTVCSLLASILPSLTESLTSASIFVQFVAS
jgi:hypothetical protein